MKSSFFLILLLTAFSMNCENTLEYDKGPCKFAPPDSNFPIIPGAFCEECFFKLKFQGKEYSFSGNRIESYYVGDYSQSINVFFNFYLDSPASNEALHGNVDVKSPLVKREVIINHTDSSMLLSSAFGIYNYCNVFFQPITDDIGQSYHRLTDIELIESYPVEINSEPFQLFSFYLTGELHATFIINGEIQLITAEYKVKSSVYEKL